MFDIIVTIVSVLYVLVCLFMVLVILLQAGRGGMGTALGGGASQSVFGGGGSSDVLAKVTQFCAGSFMVFAMFLAYAGSHAGSDRLQERSEETAPAEEDEAGEINWEAIGPNPVNLGAYTAPAAEPQPVEPVETPTDAGTPAEAPAADSGAAAEPTPAADSGAPAEPTPAADSGTPAAAPVEPAAAKAAPLPEPTKVESEPAKAETTPEPPKTEPKAKPAKPKPAKKAEPVDAPADAKADEPAPAPAEPAEAP
jgi:preprotein translocase subunit SecG